MDQEIKDLINDIKSQSDNAGEGEREVEIEVVPVNDKQKSEQLLAFFDNLVQTIKATNDTLIAAVKSIKLDPPKVTVNPPEIIIPKVDIPQPKVIVNNPSSVDLNEPKWLDLTLKGAIKPLIDLVFRFKLPTKATEAIPVRISDGKKFIDALNKVGDTIVTGGGGGYKEVNATIREVKPTDETKLNPSISISYDGSNQPITITKTISGVTYTKTLTWTNGQLTGVSAWSQI